MIDIIAPFEQEGTKAIVRSWLRKPGERIALNDPLVELETDKVTQEVPAPADGVLEEILLDTDAEAVPGALLGRMRETSELESVRVERSRDTPAPEHPSTASESSGQIGTNGAETRLSPAVRRAVRQHGLDPDTIQGTGRDGRITRADVDRLVAERAAAPAVARPESAPASSASKAKVIPHDRMRLAIAENMLNSVTTAPHVTAVFEADFSAVLAHRARQKTTGEAATITAYIVAACVAAMKAVPAINGRWFADRLEIPKDINIGVGAALGDRGLVVPVIHRAQELSLAGIAARLADVTARARADKLTPADMRGGTFTISNHGVSGSLFASPIIIQQPQSAILGVGKLEKRVVVREVGGADAIQIRPMAYVSLTIDHRVVDGHQTNAWLTRFVETLEGWER